MRLLATILYLVSCGAPTIEYRAVRYTIIIAFEKRFSKWVYPKDQLVCPPGGANTRQEGRPVMT